MRAVINVMVVARCNAHAYAQALTSDECSLAGKLKDLGNTVLGKFGMSLG